MNKLIQTLFEKGKKLGFSDMEVIIQQNDSFEVKIYEQEIDSYKVSDSSGMGFRGMFEGKMGYSYTEKLAADSIEILLSDAMQNAKINDATHQDEIFEGSPKYTKTDNYFNELDEITVEQKIDFAKRMEAHARSLDKRVKSCPYCFFGSGTGKSAIVNTKGVDLDDRANSIYCFIDVLAEQDGDMSDGFAYCFESDFSKFDAQGLAKEATEKALSYLGAGKVATGEYKAVILNTVSSDILGAISSSFSARAVQKGVSYFKGKLGTKVASDVVTLIDNPFLEGKPGTSSFDGEGVATKYKEIITKGVLSTYLHNMKTAKIDNVETTGNASRSYKSNISIAPTNLYFEKDDIGFDDMLSAMDDGIVITEVSALHSGFNAISGDFSLPAKGYTVKEGKLDRYFRQVTIAGNYFELINDVLKVSDDLIFGTSGNIGSPSMLIKKISVAGE